MIRRWISGLAPAAQASTKVVIATVRGGPTFLPNLRIFVDPVEKWGEGFWIGEPGPAIIEERCTFSPMLEHERGPSSPKD